MLKMLRGGRRAAAIWWLIIIGTAVSFIIGFSVAPSIVGTGEVAGSTVLGTVNGEPIRQEDLLQTYTQLAQAYRAETGREPEGREQAMLREQAWVQLLTERALIQEAERLGLGATDQEVVFAVRNTPPPWIRLQPAFQTNGQFDSQKYLAALSDPAINWSPLEAEVRRTLPAQKLEERILASSKFSEPELRRAFLDQYERAKVTVARWNAAVGPIDTTGFTDAKLRDFYKKQPGKFAGPAEANAVVVVMPKRPSPEEERAALDRANQTVQQARSGASFAQLARDVSEAANAAQGGELPQDFQLGQLPTEVAAKVGAVTDSAVLDPIRDGNSYYIVQVRRAGTPAAPSFRIRQILIKIRPSETALREDFERLQKLRKEANAKGLGPAAAALGIGAQETGWFNANVFVPQLYTLPQAQQFALTSKVGDVSPIFEQENGWTLVQVKERREEGVRPFEQARREVRLAIEQQARLEPAMRAAERALARVRGGATLEQAAAAEAAAQVSASDWFTRSQPGPQLGSSRAVGLAFGQRPGEVGGPVTAPMAALLVRTDAFEPAPAAAYDSVKANISRGLLNARQQRGFVAWLDWFRGQSKIRDLRGDVPVAQ